MGLNLVYGGIGGRGRGFSNQTEAILIPNYPLTDISFENMERDFFTNIMRMIRYPRTMTATVAESLNTFVQEIN